MSANAWWSVLGAALGAVLTGAILAWLGRSRLPDTGEGDARLSHPPGLLWIGIACLVMFGGFAIVANVLPNDPAPWWTTLIFVAFALLAVALIVEYRNVRHRFDDDGLAFRGLSGRRLFLRWRDIEGVRYSGVAKWFVLRTRDGSVVRISILLRGLPAFARRLLREAPPDAIDAPSRELLRAIAAGRLPPLA